MLNPFNPGHLVLATPPAPASIVGIPSRKDALALQVAIHHFPQVACGKALASENLSRKAEPRSIAIWVVLEIRVPFRVLTFRV